MIYVRELPVVLKILVVLNRLVNAEEEKSVTTVFWQCKGKKSQCKTYFHVTNSHALSFILLTSIIWFKNTHLYRSMNCLVIPDNNSSYINKDRSHPVFF